MWVRAETNVRVTVCSSWVRKLNVIRHRVLMDGVVFLELFGSLVMRVIMPVRLFTDAKLSAAGTPAYIRVCSPCFVLIGSGISTTPRRHQLPRKPAFCRLERTCD